MDWSYRNSLTWWILAVWGAWAVIAGSIVATTPLPPVAEMPVQHPVPVPAEWDVPVPVRTVRAWKPEWIIDVPRVRTWRMWV
jgi:hypothetical protein